MGRHVRRAVGRSGSPSRGSVSMCHQQFSFFRLVYTRCREWRTVIGTIVCLGHQQAVDAVDAIYSINHTAPLACCCTRLPCIRTGHV